MAMFKGCSVCLYLFCVFIMYCDGVEYSLLSYMKNVYRTLNECGHYSYYTCLKVKGLEFLENALEDDEIQVSNGILFQRVTSDEVRLPNRSDEVVTEKNVNTLLIDRVKRFISSHSLKINLQDFSSDNEVKGRDRRNDFFRKGGGQILILGGLMTGAIGAIALSGISLISGTALLVSKIALTLAIILGLCKLMENKKKNVMYEVIKPHKQLHEIDYSDGHELIIGAHGGGDLSGIPIQYGGNMIGAGGSNFGRSLDNSNSHFLAYNSHVQKGTPVPKNVLTPSS